MAAINLSLKCLDDRIGKLSPGQFIYALYLICPYKPLPDILGPGFHDTLGLCIVLRDAGIKSRQDICGPLFRFRRITAADTKLIFKP